MQLIESKAVGWSSGSVSHLVSREGGAIRSWPIVEFSLTPTPAESRLSGAVSAKGTDPASPVDINPTLETTKDIDMDEEQLKSLMSSVSEQTAQAVVQSMKTAEEQRQADHPAPDYKAEIEALKDQNKALSKDVQALLKHMEDEPAIRKAGYYTQDGGAADPEAKSFGDFLLAISRSDHKRLRDVYKSSKALEENSGVTGGYLVPNQFVSQLRGIAVEEAIVRPRAFILPMTGRTATIPAIEHSVAYQKGTSTAFGGMAMSWTAERAKIKDTEPTYYQLKLEAHKMSGKVPVSNELLADSAIGLEALLVRLFGEAVAFTEDDAFLQGDGNGKPLGVLNAPATITTTSALTSAAPTVAELSTMYSRLGRPYRRTAVWVVQQLLTDSLMSINATASSNTMLTWLPNIRGEIEPRLFGRPVVETEKLPTTFANGGLILADFQQYVVGSRQQIEIAMSSEAGEAFERDETVWRCISRCDGQPWMNAPRKIGGGTNDTVSAYVKSK
jgi:HK97 family phage major capsid protein